MPTTSRQLDPESLVARIIAELQANPDAQGLLLRALLTREFLGMPVRLERIEADIAKLKANVNVLTDRMGRTETDIAALKGDMLESKIHRRIRPLISQRLELRRARMMQSSLQDTSPALFEPVENAFDHGVITDAQESRIDTTDIILRARRKSDYADVWVAIEVSNDISQNDIERAQQSATALSVVFPEDVVVAVAAGYRIRSEDQERADNTAVHILLVDETG